MRITLTRHGETEENIARIVQGQLPGHLSANGIAQAKELAIKLKDEQFDAVFCSDLQRCVDTAAEIKQFHKGVPISYHPELRELNFGSLQGKVATAVDWRFADNTDGTLVYGGGESNLQVAERVLRFINSLLPEYQNKNILIVSHGGPIRAIQASVEQKPYGPLFRTVVPNAEPMVFEITQELMMPVY